VVALAVLTFSLLLCSTARADTYCVAPAHGHGCDADHKLATIQDALNHVASDGGGGGEVALGSTTYHENSLQYSGSVPVSLLGSDRGQTTLTNDGSSSVVLFSGSGPVTVQDLAITIPSGSGRDGIASLDPLTVSNVTITGSGTPNGEIGIVLHDGTVMNTTITLPVPSSGLDTAIFAVPAASTTTTVLDSSLTAVNGIDDAGAGNVSAHRLRVSAAGTADNTGGAFTVEAGSQASVDDSLVQLHSGGVGIGASIVSSGASGSLAARHLTIVGDGTGTGVRALSTAGTASVALSDSIIRNVAHSVDRNASGSGTANVSIDHSDYPADPGHISDTGGSGAYTATNDIDADPLFAGSTDFRLLPASPALNRDAAAPLAGESATDVDRNPRFVPGAQRDMGAYQHQPPSAAASAAPDSEPVGVAFSFSGTGSDSDPGDSLSYSWSFDDGGSAPGATVNHAFATTGTHTGTVTVTDATGLTSTATATVTVISPPSGGAGSPAPSPGGSGGASDAGGQIRGDLEPIGIASIDGLRLTHSVFALGPQPTAISAQRSVRTSAHGTSHGVKRGTTFEYTLDTPATVTISLQRATPGTLRGGQCSVKSSRAARHAPHCTHYTPVGALTRQGVAGANSTPFSGRIGTRALKPGHYQASLVANNAAGDSAVRTVRFTIVRG
jgi:hypothetical protein